MEEVLLRFGHLGKQVFNNLDIQSLNNCSEVSRSWEEFIHRGKISSFQKIKHYSNLPDASIRKFLRKFDTDQSEIMANHVKMVYKKRSTFPKSDRPYPFHFAAENGYFLVCELIIAHSENKILRISCAVSSYAAAEWAKPSTSAAALRRHGMWNNPHGYSAQILCAYGILRIP